MKKAITLLLISLYALMGYSCSAFKYIEEGQVFVAKNFDWFNGKGYLLKNNQNQSKCSYLSYKGKNTCWVSKFGSITFNQNGKEFPYGGINEKGLVVEMLWLKETQYSEKGMDATTLSELEWIQYQLDNYSTVEEVLKNIDKLIIDPITSTIHYFVVDQTGKSAIIEYIKGEVNITKSSEQVQNITNGSNSTNEAFYVKSQPVLGEYYRPKSRDSRIRYCSVRNNLEKFPADKAFNKTSAFEILEAVSENKESYKTYWTLLYDLSNLNLVFKTFGNDAEKTLSLKDLDFTDGMSLYFDLSSDTDQENIKEVLQTYSPEANYELIKTCIQPTLSFDYTQLNKHQLNPIQSHTDKKFTADHRDIVVTILTNETTGFVRYFLADSEQNYRRQGPFGGNIEINSTKTLHKLYSIPTNKEYAYGAMHDVNGNGYLDRNFIKMPKEPFAFSGKKRFFFLPPKFKKATFDFTPEITIEIK